MTYNIWITKWIEIKFGGYLSVRFETFKLKPIEIRTFVLAWFSHWRLWLLLGNLALCLNSENESPLLTLSCQTCCTDLLCTLVTDGFLSFVFLVGIFPRSCHLLTSWGEVVCHLIKQKMVFFICHLLSLCSSRFSHEGPFNKSWLLLLFLQWTCTAWYKLGLKLSIV
jgi:hypothetical protein